MSEISKQYEAELLKAGLSKTEVSAVIDSLEILVKKGATKSDIAKVVERVKTNSDFTKALIKDPSTLIGKFGDVTF